MSHLNSIAERRKRLVFDDEEPQIGDQDSFSSKSHHHHHRELARLEEKMVMELDDCGKKTGLAKILDTDGSSSSSWRPQDSLPKSSSLGTKKKTNNQNMNNSSDNLITSMASRLSNLEISRRELRKKLVDMEKQVMALRTENELLRKQAKNEHDVERIRSIMRENQEMKEFLADYGLVWVGDGDGAQRMEHDIDFDLVIKQLEELNAMVGKNSAYSKSLMGTVHGLEYKETISLALFANGILVKRGPFRPFSSPEAQRFLRDCMDGYFPIEFKDQYPDGVAFEIKDCRYEEYDFSKACNMYGDSVCSVTNRVPEFIIKDGKVLRPRESLRRNLLKPSSSRSDLVVQDGGENKGAHRPESQKDVSQRQHVFVSDTLQGGKVSIEEQCSILVHYEKDKKKGKVVLKLVRSETIFNAKYLLCRALRSVDDPLPLLDSDVYTISLRTTHPPKTYDDKMDDKTLEEVGWCPNIVVRMLINK